MGTLATSDDPDEMLHIAAFHHGLHDLLRLKRYSERDIQFQLEIKKITLHPLMYTMNYLKFIISYQVEEVIRIQVRSRPYRPSSSYIYA